MKTKKKIINSKKFLSMLKNIRKVDWKTFNIFQKLRLERYTKSAIVLASIIIFLTVNLLLGLVSIRLDLSKDKVYTLSPATKKLISNLKSEAKITLYKSDNIPARATPVEREIVDLLKEFDRASNNVEFETITFNPQEDVETAQKASSLGIYPLSVSQQNQGEVSLSEIFFGVVLTFNDKSEAIVQSLNYADLEYSLTAGLYRLSNEKLAEVGLLGFQTDPATNRDPISNFRNVISGFFKLTNITEKIPEEVKTLVIRDDPAKDFTDAEIKLIEDYIKNGKTIAFTDGVTVGDQALETASGEAKLHNIFKKQGIEVKNNLILSAQSELVNLGNSGFSVFIPYALWIKADNFSKTSEFFNSVSSLTFPWSSEVRALDNKDFKTEELVFTTNQSWEQNKNFAIFPQQIPKPNQTDFKVYPVAAESKGKNSALTVIGSSRFIYDQYLSPESSNIPFIVNILSDYASDGVLSGIAKRQTQVYALPILPKSAEEVYKYLNILLFPIMFGVYGTYRIIKRSREV